MQKIILFFFISISLSSLQGQNYRYVETDIFEGFSERIWKVIPVEEGIITMGSRICYDTIYRDCTFYALFDYDGNVLVQKTIPYIDVQFEDIFYDADNQEVVIAGHTSPNSKILHLYKCNINGDSLFHQTYEIPITTTDGYVLAHAVTKFNNQYQIVGQVVTQLTTPKIIDSYIIWINMDGTLDSLDIATNLHTFREPQIDNAGVLTVCYIRRDAQTLPYPADREGFIKYNENKEVVWQWETDFWFKEGRYTSFDFTATNEIVYTFEASYQMFDLPWDEQGIAMISDSGETLWQYIFNTSPYKLLYLYEVKVAENGDILCAGTMRDITEESQDGTLYETLYICRFSPAGELLWERRFRNYNDAGGVQWQAGYDIVELENGGLLMCGRVYDNILVAPLQIFSLLVFTDSEGCIEPDCEELIILDAKEHIFSEEELRLIQNPVENVLSLSIQLDIPENLSYAIFDAMGKKLDDGQLVRPMGSEQIDVLGLPNGIYFLYLFSEGKRKTIRFVKG